MKKRQLERTSAIVVRAVRRGAAVEDPRLARAVGDYAEVVKRRAARDRKYSWVLWTFAAGTLILAAATTVDGPVRAAIVWWVLFVFWVVQLVRLPRRRAKNVDNAMRAEAEAGRLWGGTLTINQTPNRCGHSNARLPI